MGTDEIKEKLKIILIEPRFSINLGLILRTMKNFGFKNIILVNPRCKINSEKAKQFSMKGKDLIKEIKIYDSLKKLKEEGNFLIGTTRVLGRYRSKAYSPNQIIRFIKTHPSPALVFGNEERGLNREEIRACDMLSKIPTVEGQEGSINLAIAVSIYLYEISKEKIEKKENIENEKIFSLYNFIIEELSQKGVLENGNYRHNKSKIMDLILRMELKDEEIKFLWYIIRMLKSGSIERR